MTVNLHVLLTIYPAAYGCKLQVIPIVQQFAVSQFDVVCWFVCRDTLKWMTADISCLIHIKRKLFDGNVIWWCLSQHISGILRQTHTTHQVMTYSRHCYSEGNDGHDIYFALLELMKCTNLDTKDSACLHVVHILQHPTSCPTIRSTHDTMVNALIKNLLQFWQAHMANRPRSPHVDILKQINARAPWCQKRLELWECCVANDLTRSFWHREGRKHTYKQQRETEMDQGLWGERDCCGKNAISRCRDSDHARAERYDYCGKWGYDNQTAWNNVWRDVEC